jgi:hypothetical protein
MTHEVKRRLVVIVLLVVAVCLGGFWAATNIRIGPVFRIRIMATVEDE